MPSTGNAFALQMAVSEAENFHDDWYPLVKACFPVADSAIARMLGTTSTQLWRWKSGKWIPRRPSLQAVRVLVFLRLCGFTDTRPLIHLATWMKTAKLWPMLAEVQRQEAEAKAKQAEKRRLKRLAKLAASETQRDIPPTKTPKSA